MTSEQEETMDAAVPPPGERQAKRRPPPRGGDAGYRKRAAVIGIAAVPSVVLAHLLLCGISGALLGLLGTLFSGDPLSLFLLVIVPGVLEGVVLVPGIYSLVRRSRRAGGVTLALGAVAVLFYLRYTWLIWVIVLMGSPGARIAH